MQEDSRKLQKSLNSFFGDIQFLSRVYITTWLYDLHKIIPRPRSPNQLFIILRRAKEMHVLYFIYCLHSKYSICRLSLRTLKFANFPCRKYQNTKKCYHSIVVISHQTWFSEVSLTEINAVVDWHHLSSLLPDFLNPNCRSRSRQY